MQALTSSAVSTLIVTIDGPSGTGKSTVSRAVAEEAGLPHLDTGALYRVATLAALRAGVDLDSEEQVLKAVRGADFEETDGKMILDGEDVSRQIRGEAVTAAVSQVSAYPQVRRLLVDRQREWVASHGGRAVVEGRDIGSVVFPRADVKVYLDASPEVRAQRRARQDGVDAGAIMAEIARRDHLDSTRDTSPLTVPDGAIVVDTSDLDFEEVVGEVMRLIGQRS